MGQGIVSESSDTRTLQALFFELAESLVPGEGTSEQTDDPAEWGRGRPEKVRLLLQGEVARFRRVRLAEAQEEYVRTITSLRNRKTLLPDSDEARRNLLSGVFGAFPQMHQAFLTVQHREFKQLSAKDVESFLRQLQALGVVPEDARGWKPEPVIDEKKVTASDEKPEAETETKKETQDDK